MKMFQRFLIVSCLFLSLGVVQAQEEAPSIYGDSIDVRVVNVEVVVTDGSGNRVTDLRPEDFRLKVDGKEVPIEYFTEVRSGQAMSSPAPGAPGAEAAPAASVEPGGTVGTSYLVFIDDYFSIESKRNEVLRALKDDLGRLGPEDRMAIVAWEGGKVSVVSNWSSSQSTLARALDIAMGRKARGLDRMTDLRSFRNDKAFSGQTVGDNTPLDTLSRMDASSLSGAEVAYSEMLSRQIGGAVSAAVSAMRGFAAPPGRKVMLLLSGGWPYSVVSYIRSGSLPPTSREVPDGEEMLRPLANTANLLGYTLYPVDVPGIDTVVADAASARPTGLNTFAEQEVEGSLRFLARETGGTALVNSNRSVALARTSSDVSSYYWLGFIPDWQRNDKSHKVKIEVTRRGLEVRSRTGFLDLSQKAEVSMMVESALLFGGFPGTSPLPLKLGAPVRKRRGTVEIPMTLGLPAGLFTTVPHDGKLAAQLELRIAASDEYGNSSDMPVIPLTFSGETPPAEGGFVLYETKITLRGKADELVVAVYDPISGRMATAQAKVPVL